MNQDDFTIEVFKRIFTDFKFPYFSFDTNTIAITASDRVNKISQSKCNLQYTSQSVRKEVVFAALRVLIRNINPTDDVVKTLNDANLIQPLLNNQKIESFLEYNREGALFLKGDVLTWLQASYWPAAYNSVFQQFINVIQVSEDSFIKGDRVGKKANKNNYLYTIDFRTGSKSVARTSEQPRHMPTELHYAAASIGEWIGGALSVQYFGLYATKPQILNSYTNRKYLKGIGYSDDEVKELDISGLIGVPADLYIPLGQAQGNMNTFGSLPIDEINAANLPETLPLSGKEQLEQTKLMGLIVDKYYRNVFFAKKLEKTAMYGSGDILRDHYTDFYNTIPREDMMRCKNYIAPIIEVDCYQEMEDIIKKIPKRGRGGLFFRGQTSYYNIQRGAGVRKILFGNSNSNEPSLVTSASRTNFDYDNLHFKLRNFIAETEIYPSMNEEKFKEWDRLLYDPTCKLDYTLMALAQHYGIPSHGLDVTQNLDVALWFATNKYIRDSDTAKAYYNSLKKDYWANDKSKWPVIFVFQTILNTTIQSLQDCEELKEFGLIPLRPQRQNAKFFLGGHSDHQNRLCEAVVCAFRLTPNLYETKVTFDYLFPNPYEDPTYQIMLNFREYENKYSDLAKEVNIFHA